MAKEEKNKLKNIANCAITESLAQCYKISREFERWTTATDVMNIRERLPELLDVPEAPKEDASEEEKAKAKEKISAAIEENKKRSSEQAKKNLFDMLESVLGNNVEATTNLLALCCFVDPKDKDKYTLAEYLEAFTEILESDSIFDFFKSLVRRMA